MSTPSPANRAESILIAALDHAAEDREAFLQTACDGDAPLLAELRALLAAHEAATTGFLASPLACDVPAGHFDATIDARDANRNSGKTPGPVAVARTSAIERSGDQIGLYKLREQIGEGGFGTVWVAEQEKPVKRRVALKIVKLGMDTKDVIARFEQERQALAMMDHPNIAKVLDAGETGSGRPYFVMELVRGTRITDYCDEKQLSTIQRIELFIAVCQAVQHAHQKGIIHRDLKPSNILVTIQDGKPMPKVIDFGVAKATPGRLSEHTIYTQFHQMIGTPLYMSPEQADMTSQDVDTRSDIYSLGVLLYELLTGVTPIEATTIREAGLDEMRRIIREVDPPRPSLRLKTLDANTLSTTAKRRHVEPTKLSGILKGDLDWIVMKCLEKDRQRRYDTANGLALDLRRHLDSEVITARPPTAGYLLGKLIRRNKPAFAAAAAILLTLVAGIVASTWQAIRARQAEEAAESEMQRAVAAERNAHAEAQRATAAEKLAGERLAESELARKEAETIAKFMANVFTSPVPGRDGRKVTVVQALNRAAKKLETDLADQPATRTRLQETLAVTYFELGLYREGIPILESVLNYRRAAFGPDDLKTLSSAQFLMSFYRAGNRHDDNIKLAEEYLPRMREKLGPDHRLTVYTTSLLAGAYFGTGRSDEALALRKETLPRMRTAFGREHGLTLWVMNGLAESLDEAGQKEEAIKLLEEIHQIYKEVYGTEYPSALWAMHALAVAYYANGRRDEAMKLEEEAAQRMVRVLDPQHPWTITATLTLKRWRGELPTTPDSQPTPTLAETLAETLNLPEEFVASDATEFWGERIGDSRVTRLGRSGLELNKQPDGTWEANLSKVKGFSDLTIFQGTRLSRLNLTSTDVVDLTPLRGLPLLELNLNETKVADLEPLRGMPLEVLRLTRAHVSDLSPLRGMPLTKLFVNGTKIESLEPLREMRLTELSIAGTKVSDLSVLRGMPLISLKLGKCEEIIDLSPIRDCTGLAMLTLPPNAKDISFLSRLPVLRRISYTENSEVGWIPDKTAEEFWREYDAKMKP